MRVSRKTKKKLRAIILCHSGLTKIKVSKKLWVQLMYDYSIWLKKFDMTDRRNANKIK